MCKRFSIAGVGKGRDMPKKNQEEAIREDMSQLQPTEDMILDRNA